MQSKLIKSVIAKKINKWAAAVEKEDPVVAKAIRENTVVMGGSICSMLMSEQPNDYDVYFRTKASASTIAGFYMQKFKNIQDKKHCRSQEEGESPIHVPMYLKHVENPNGFKCFIKSAGVVDDRQDKAYQYFETHSSEEIQAFFGTDNENEAAGAELGDGDENITTPEGALEEGQKAAADREKNKNEFKPVYITQNAITLSDDVQIVTRFYGDPEEILEYYDYEHCKMYYQSWDGRLKLGERPLECLLNKRLEYTGSYYPICSLFRMRKFMGRGWNINAGQIVKMAWQIHKLDLTNPEVLEEQLIGVDHAYFVEILAHLQGKMRLDGKSSIDETYLMELLDKYF